MGDSEASQRLVAARGTRTHDDVARAVGASERQIKSWESTGHVPKKWRTALADHYGVGEEALFVPIPPGTPAAKWEEPPPVVVTITSQPGAGPPEALLLAPGATKDLVVAVEVKPAELEPTFQWFKDGKPMDGEIADRITVQAPVKDPDDASADYHVVVTAGVAEDKVSVQSALAPVRLQLPPPTIKADSRQTARVIDVDIEPGEAKDFVSLIDHYVVDLDPRPPTFGLPRRTSPGDGGKLQVSIPEVPLVDRYRVVVHAVTKRWRTPGREASKDVAFATGKRPWITKTGIAWSIVALLAVVFGVIFTFNAKSVEAWALRMAGFGVVFLVSIVFVFGWHRSALVGIDGRVSTSKFQTAVSTLAVGYALLVVMGMTFGADQLCDGKNKDRGCKATTKVTRDGIAMTVDKVEFGDLIDRGLTDDYLIMLGGPFTALVLARLSVGRKVQDGTVQKVPAAGPSVSDAISDDSGRASLIDCQYLLFASLTVFYLVWQVTTQPEEGLPALPQTLVYLSSGAVLAYLGDKAIEDSKLRITALSAAEATPGDEVELRGQNLVPAGATNLIDGGVVLRVGAYGVVPSTVSSDLVAFEIPLDMPAGAHAVTLTTAAGQQETAGTVTVQRAPRLDGLSTPVAREGDRILVFGERLVGYRAPGTSPTVLFGTTATFGRLVATGGGQALEATVPGLGLAADAELDVQVTVQPAGEQPSRDRLALKVKPKA